MKILKLNSTLTRVIIPIVGVVIVVFWLYFSRLDIATSLAYRGIDPKQPEARALAEWLVDTAPNDPFAHAEAARFLEGTFEPGDLERSLREYESAVALSPDHFVLWKQLGAARDRMGDAAGAEAAYERALQLAPNYAAVQWAYGNSLIRHGKLNEGFALIARACESDPAFADPAASVSLQALGNPEAVRQVLGSNSRTNAAIANVYSSQAKFADALDAWSRVEPEAKSTIYKDVGLRLMSRATDAHQTRIAASIFGDLFSAGGERPTTGNILNGTFESGLKLRNAGVFEWQIGEGSDPQFGLSEGTKRSGNYSLLLTFNAFEASSFRTISQRIAVEPGATYDFAGFYRADIKSNATFKWEMVDARTSAVLGATEAIAVSGDWTSLKAKFTVPEDADGIVLRLARIGCTSAVCPVSGRIFFDDLSLKKL